MLLYCADAFTSVALAENPAAVRLLDDDFLADAWLQEVTAELGQPVTAFIGAVAVRGDRVQVGGTAVAVMRGELSSTIRADGRH